jgi:hypothetical protein
VKHRSIGVELAESDGLVDIMVRSRISDRLAMLRGLQHLAVFITPPARQAWVQIFTPKRYAGTEPTDARTGKPESQFNISLRRPHSCAAAIFLG